MSDTLKEYRNFIVAYLRDFESSRMASDPDKLRRLSETPDDLILKKWLWIGTIVGAIGCFGILWPVAALILAPFITTFIMEPLWMLIKFAMGLTLLMFCAALYVTFSKS